MPQLIGALIVIFLYLVWVSFLLSSVGPNLLLILAVSFVGGSLYYLAQSFFRVYAREDRGWAYWLPALVAVTYLYFEYIRFIAMASAETLVGSGLVILVSAIPLPSLATLFFGGLAGGLETELLLVVDSVLVGIVLYPCILFGRGLRGTKEDNEEPAYLWYFHGEAFAELTRATVGFGSEIVGYTRKFVQLIFTTTFATPKWWLLWPLGVTAYVGLGAAGLQAGLVIGIWLLAFGLGSALVWITAQYLALLMRGFERAVLKIRAGYVKCPQAHCGDPIPLPIFRCPNCDAAHKKLLPGRTGIFRRQCQCGSLLPTLNWFGKSGLPSECCHCGNSLGKEMFGANLHIPIYGGRSAGKSTFLASATNAAISDQPEDISFDWVMDKDRKQFEEQWRPILAKGSMLSATIEKLPDAFLLCAQGEGGLPVSLYLYDPSGEAMTNEADLGEHGFVGYSGGLILVIDPLSFERIRSEMETLPEDVRPVSPTEVLQRVVQQLESLAGLSRAKRFDKPVAVVVSKADLPPVARSLSPESDADDVREWLLGFEPALVHNLETRFSRLSYFAVSALDSVRSGSAQDRTLAPLAWLLSSFRVLSQPRLTRWGGFALEAAAAVSLFIVGLTVPILLSIQILAAWG